MALVRIRGASADPPDRVRQLQQLLHTGGVTMFDIAPNMLLEIIGDRAWSGRQNSAGETFRSFEDFAHQPLWDGLGCTVEDLLAICRKRLDAQTAIRREVGPMADWGRVDNVNSKTVGGNNPTYALRRLKRDRPDLAQKVIDGEMSAHAAAIEAGFRKKPVRRCPKCGHEW